MHPDLNIKALRDLFNNTNTSYKFLYFCSLIKIIHKINLKKTISYNEILNKNAYPCQLSKQYNYYKFLFLSLKKKFNIYIKII